MDPIAFQQELSQAEINLPRAALWYARNIAYPDLDIERHLHQIEEHIEQASKQVSTNSSITERAEAIASYLFVQCGFRGNREAYGDPANSYLNAVLERRVGIPISLSLLYITVARALDVPAYGISMPGHFVVGLDDELGKHLLDPYNEGVWLAQSDCERLVAQTTGYQGPFQNVWLNPTPPRMILARMLNNLRVTYLRNENWEHTLRVVNHLQIVQPEVGDHVRDEGLVYYQTNRIWQAANALQRYIQMEPESSDVPVIKRTIQEKLEKWGRLN